MVAPNTKVVQIDTAVPSDSAKALRRKVYEALEGAYDEQKKRYRAKLKGENSDKSIAEEIGCSVALVEKVREEFFGPADRAEPTEQIKAMQIKLSHLERESDDMDKLAKGLAQQVKEHRNKVGVLKDDLKSLCLEFGWAH